MGYVSHRNGSDKKRKAYLDRRQTVLENKNDIYKIHVFAESVIFERKTQRVNRQV